MEPGFPATGVAPNLRKDLKRLSDEESLSRFHLGGCASDICRLGSLSSELLALALDRFGPWDDLLTVHANFQNPFDTLDPILSAEKWLREIGQALVASITFRQYFLTRPVVPRLVRSATGLRFPPPESLPLESRTAHQR